jgi:predicted site-specific integrase-resolvase
MQSKNKEDQEDDDQETDAVQLKRHYTEKEFCQMMGIERTTAVRWRKTRKIGYLRMPGGRIRYLRKHIEEFEQKAERRARAA